MKPPNLSVDIAGLVLKNPILTASGTFGYGREFSAFMDIDKLGGMVIKGLSLEPSPGNPPPRTVETCGGMINAIGLENIGLQTFIKEKWPYLQTINSAVIVNLYGREAAEYVELTERVSDIDGIAGIELNISCPNVKAGGLVFGTDPVVAAQLTASVRKKTRLPLIVKLSPNVTDISAIARSVEDAGADAISLINTITALAVDVPSRRPKLANIIGGLSGPAIKPIALRMVWEVVKAVQIPVIGIGGIMTAQDALEFLIVGAKAVQIGTANFVNPHTPLEVIEGLSSFLAENNIADVNDLIGTLVV
jgi:dihydroorotate dehydrogenase (NAD+) catalytic subunit